MPKNKSGYQGLGGSSFQEDMEKGLGKQGSDNSNFNSLGGNSFGDDMDTGLGNVPQQNPDQKKKRATGNILDEWTNAAGGGW